MSRRNNSINDDTKKPGFVSAIVMKFTQASNTTTNDFSPPEVKIRKQNKPIIVSKWRDSQISDQSKHDLTPTSIDNPEIQAEMKVFGTISVKDRIKAFTEMEKYASSSVKIIHNDQSHSKPGRISSDVSSFTKRDSVVKNMSASMGNVNVFDKDGNKLSISSGGDKSNEFSGYKTRVRVSEMVQKINRAESLSKESSNGGSVLNSPNMITRQQKIDDKSNSVVSEQNQVEKDTKSPQPAVEKDTKSPQPAVEKDTKSPQPAVENYNLSKSDEVQAEPSSKTTSETNSDVEETEQVYEVYNINEEPNYIEESNVSEYSENNNNEPDSIFIYNITTERESSEAVHSPSVDANREVPSQIETASESCSLSSIDSLMAAYDANILDIYDPSTEANYHPLPETYEVKVNDDGSVNLKLPEPCVKSILKTLDSPKRNLEIKFDEKSLTKTMETYNPVEYERGDDSIDPLTASAEYEIEKKTENLEKFEIEITKDDHGLGLSIVGIGLGSDMGSEKLGIYIKALTPGGAAEKTKKLQIHDQLLEVDGTSLVGVTQSFAAQTLKATSKIVKFLIGREEVVDEA